MPENVYNSGMIVALCMAHGIENADSAGLTRSRHKMLTQFPIQPATGAVAVNGRTSIYQSIYLYNTRRMLSIMGERELRLHSES